MTTPYAGVDSFPATIPLPQDLVDKRSASVFNACYRGLMDAVRWLKNRAGAYRIAQVSDAYIDPDIGTVKGSSDQITWGTGDVKIGEVTIEENDIVKVAVTMHVSCTAAASLVGYRLAYKLDGGAAVPLPGATLVYFRDLGGGEPVHLTGQAWFGVGEAGDGDLELFVQMKSVTGSTVSVASPLCPWIEVLRSQS